MTIRQALIFGTNRLKENDIGSASLDAEILLLHSLNQFKKINSKSWLYAHSEYKLKEKEKEIFFDFISKRQKYKPTAYIIKKKEFFSLDFYVDSRVMIPRPETELIVESMLSYFSQNFLKQNNPKKLNIIDIGAGSGCIAVTLAKYLSLLKKFWGQNKIYALDISKEAIEIAKLNAKKHKVKKKIIFLQGNLLEPLCISLARKNYLKKFFSEQITAIAANLPYLNCKQYRNSQKEIKKYEPKGALYGGKNGLKYIKNLFKQLNFINPVNCILWLEIDPFQINETAKLAKKYFRHCQIKIIKDLAQYNRILKIKLY